jgi:uncharacterized protein (DUF302 family)
MFLSGHGFYRAVLAGVILLATSMAGDAQEIVTRTRRGSFDDVRFDLGNAVIATGVTIQSQGNIAAMLGRTAADVGATETVYARAEFIAICSVRYSRALMEADPANLAFCPFTVFIYEAKTKPDEIVVGYRPVQVPVTQSATARNAAAEVNALLQKIVDDAVK